MESAPVPYRLPKRLLDKSVALVLLAVLAPFFAIAWIAVGVDMLLCRRDRGSWLYREPRVSRGRVFGLLKFRTVRRDALERQRGTEAHARLLELDATNLTWAGKRVLKPWYLDELPQILNVLRGDMSLVGPRPWPPSLVHDQVASGVDYRNLIVAGWTGPVQVQKGIADPEGYAALDRRYVEACRSWSGMRLLRLDLGILWRTVKIMARGEGLRF